MYTFEVISSSESELKPIIEHEQKIRQRQMMKADIKNFFIVTSEENLYFNYTPNPCKTQEAEKKSPREGRFCVIPLFDFFLPADFSRLIF
jgi:hypothetical protein